MPENNSLTSFIESIRSRNLAIVEDHSITLAQLKSNVGDFDRDFPCVLKVLKKSDLTGIIEDANRWRIPLFPYSRGMNWGYGSQLPTKYGCALLDLSGLNKIIQIDEEHGIATIEPGVTQQDLAEELIRRDSRYYLDVTGSGAETSILGNALERGIAYGSLRAQQLTGMEILLGNGKTFRTGFGGFPNPNLAGLYSFGLGPSLDGLFFQSNFGIVTEGCIQLSLRPERMVGLTVAIKDENIPAFIDQVRDLLRQGFLHGIPHLANRERTSSTIIPLVAKQLGGTLTEAKHMVDQVIGDEWILTAAVTGSSAIVTEKLKHIKKALKPFGRVYCQALICHSWQDRIKSWLLERILTQSQRTIFKATEPLRAFHRGQPSNAGIQFLLKDSNTSVDENPEGFLLCTPLAPLCGESAKTFKELTEQLSAKHQVRFAMTLNMLTGRVLEAVISLHFKRSNVAEKNRAHACLDDLTKAFLQNGFYPYRANIDQQQDLVTLSPVLAAVTGSIKKALDPNGILAPGRYADTIF